MKSYTLLIVFLALNIQFGVVASDKTAPQAKPVFNLKTVGSRIKMGLNKSQSIMDVRGYSEVQLRSGERLLWNQSGKSAYQVKGVGNEVFARTNNSNTVKQSNIRMRGRVDADALARYQGQLAEAQARINITQARLDGLKLKQGAGMATADDLRNLSKLQKQLPKYQKAYRSLETRTTLSGSSIGRTVKAGFNGALAAAGIHAGISLLSDTIDHDGNVNVSRALSYMAEPKFLGGIAGGTVGAMVLSSLPVPGIGGGILKALPMFMGGAVGFEVGSGNIERVNWVRMIGSTTASAVAFGLIGGPLGIGASILAGMVVDQLFESPDPNEGYVQDPFIPDWGQIAGTQGSFTQSTMEIPPYFPTGEAPLNQPIEATTAEQGNLPAGDILAEEKVIQTPKSPSLIDSSQSTAVDPSKLETLNSKLRYHYDNYVKSIKNKDAKTARSEFEKYKSVRDHINMIRNVNIK